MKELSSVDLVGVQGQCSGGLWPITDTTIGSLAVSWRYYLASNTVQFIIQGIVFSLSISRAHTHIPTLWILGQLASNVDLTSTYVAIGWSEAPPTIVRPSTRVTDDHLSRVFR